jgi:hypothetical protein
MRQRCVNDSGFLGRTAVRNGTMRHWPRCARRRAGTDTPGGEFFTLCHPASRLARLRALDVRERLRRSRGRHAAPRLARVELGDVAADRRHCHPGGDELRVASQGDQCFLARPRASSPRCRRRNHLPASQAGQDRPSARRPSLQVPCVLPRRARRNSSRRWRARVTGRPGSSSGSRAASCTCRRGRSCPRGSAPSS